MSGSAGSRPEDSGRRSGVTRTRSTSSRSSDPTFFWPSSMPRGPTGPGPRPAGRVRRAVDPLLRRIDEPMRRWAWAKWPWPEGRFADAIAEFEAYVPTPRPCLPCGQTALAQAYDRAGNSDSSIAVYERFLTTRKYVLPLTWYPTLGDDPTSSRRPASGWVSYMSNEATPEKARSNSSSLCQLAGGCRSRTQAQRPRRPTAVTAARDDGTRPSGSHPSSARLC